MTGAYPLPSAWGRARQCWASTTLQQQPRLKDKGQGSRRASRARQRENECLSSVSPGQEPQPWPRTRGQKICRRQISTIHQTIPCVDAGSKLAPGCNVSLVCVHYIFIGVNKKMKNVLCLLYKSREMSHSFGHFLFVFIRSQKNELCPKPAFCSGHAISHMWDQGSTLFSENRQVRPVFPRPGWSSPELVS